MKLESQQNNVVWRMNANPSSNVMYAIYVVVNTLVIIASLLRPKFNFQKKYYILSPILNVNTTNRNQMAFFSLHCAANYMQHACTHKIIKILYQLKTKNHKPQTKNQKPKIKNILKNHRSNLHIIASKLVQSLYIPTWVLTS